MVDPNILNNIDRNFDDIKDKYKFEYIEIINRLIQEIKDRFKKENLQPICLFLKY